MRSLLFAGACALLTAANAGAQQVEVEEFTLDNGMTFLLLPRFEEPNSISCGWVARVGSVNERPGITGISHFFEHMMFKGTNAIGTRDPEADARYRAEQKAIKDQINEITWTGQYARYFRGEIDDPWDPANDTEELRSLRAKLRGSIELHRTVIVTNEYAQIYTDEGGTGMNAFTSEDLTFYIVSVPSNKFELWAWMESDRLSDSVFREFYAERDVVHEERRLRLESSSTGELDEQFDAMFWQSSPYSWSVIGWPSDLNSYTREQAEQYFNIYYRPNNLIGVVVGDFETEAIKPVIREYFGRLSRGAEEPPPVVTLEVEQLAEKRMNGSCDCQPQVRIQYHTVPFNHTDSFPLAIMAEILNGRTGRLYKSMIEGAEIASSAFTGQDSRKYGGYFMFSADVKGEATPEDLEAAWYAELERLQTEPVTDYELEKVKNQIAADNYRRLQSNNSLRVQLGIYEAMGGWEYINESPAKLTAVTAADIMRVANTYFDETNRNVATYTRAEKKAVETELSEEEIAFAQLPEEMKPHMYAALDRIRDYDLYGLVKSRNGLNMGLGMDLPEVQKVALRYLLKKTEERIAELEAAGETIEE